MKWDRGWAWEMPRRWPRPAPWRVTPDLREKVVEPWCESPAIVHQNPPCGKSDTDATQSLPFALQMVFLRGVGTLSNFGWLWGSGKRADAESVELRPATEHEIEPAV